LCVDAQASHAIAARARRDCHPAQAQPQSPALIRRDLYKERNLIERFFNKLKQFRRVATRYDKLLDNFMGFVKIAVSPFGSDS